MINMIKEKKSSRWNTIARARFAKFIKEYSSKSIYKTIGIIASIGIGGFLAFKYIPWNKITDKFEMSFDEVFGEGEFNFPEAAENSAL
jgi:hypothetical protein